MNNYVIKVVKECYVSIAADDQEEAVENIMEGYGRYDDEEIVDVEIIEEEVTDNYAIMDSCFDDDYE